MCRGPTTAPAASGYAGTSTAGFGVYGTTYGDSKSGVNGQDSSTEGGFGVSGSSNAGTGVSGNGSIGVTGTGVNYGLQGLNDNGLPLQLVPPTGVTALPTGPLVVPGTFAVLSDGSLHYCQTEGEWISLGQGVTVPIAPFRVIDTTDGTGGITGRWRRAPRCTPECHRGHERHPGRRGGVRRQLRHLRRQRCPAERLGVAAIFPAGEATPPTANINAGRGATPSPTWSPWAWAPAPTPGRSRSSGGGGAVPDAQAFLDVTAYIL